jgi:hypothetical protein
MAVQTTTLRNTLVDAYKAAATHMSLHTVWTAGATPGAEVSGGAPAYARKASNWGATAASAATAAPAAFDVPSGATIAAIGLYNALTAGTYQDGKDVTSQPFNSQGTYTVTATYTQT